jgi:hypothetical protein
MGFSRIEERDPLLNFPIMQGTHRLLNSMDKKNFEVIHKRKLSKKKSEGNRKGKRSNPLICRTCHAEAGN